MDLSLFGQSRDAERRRPAAHPVLAPGSPTPRARGPTRRSTQLNTLLWLPQSGASEDGHFLSLRRTQTLHSPGLEKSLNLETVATLPAGWDSAHAIRLGIKPFAELGANSEALSGSQVDSPCSLPSDPRIGPGNVAIVSESSRFPECYGIVCTLFFTHSKVGRAQKFLATHLRLGKTGGLMCRWASRRRHREAQAGTPNPLSIPDNGAWLNTPSSENPATCAIL